jgi:SAM-dependent methyltransferase
MEHGVDIEGFDISEEMLMLCRIKAQKLHLKPTVFFTKLEEFESDKKYDLVIIPFGSFSLLPDELVKVSLSNMRAALKEDGLILVTVMTNKGPIEEIPNWIETNRQLVDTNEIVEYKKLYFDEKSNVINTTLKYHLVKNGVIVKEELMDFPIRVYENGEFETILKSNGLEKFNLHEVLDGYDVGSSFQVFECMK